MSRAIIQCILISIKYSYVYFTKLTKVPRIQILLLQMQKNTKKPHFKCGQKNMWKRIPHLMQEHETPRKGHSTVNLHELIKSKCNLKK